MNKKTKTIIWIIVAVVVVGLIGVFISDFLNAAREISFTAFMNKLAAGEINELYVDGYVWTGRLINTNGSVVASYSTIAPSLYDYEAVNLLLRDLAVKGISLDVSFTDPNEGSIWSSLLPLLGVVLTA